MAGTSGRQLCAQRKTQLGHFTNADKLVYDRGDKSLVIPLILLDSYLFIKAL